MAYADRNKRGTQVTTGIIVGAAVGVFLFLLVAALNFHATKKLITHLTTEEVKDKKPDEKKPDPPKQKVEIKLPPPVVIPPPIVKFTPPPTTAPPPVFQQPKAEPVEIKPPPPPPPKPKLAKPAVLKGGEITDEDYPDAARRNNETGTSVASYVVGTDGHVQSCEASGATSTLNAEACKLIQRRFRYAPAQDDAGNPISQSLTRRIKWQIPAE